MLWELTTKPFDCKGRDRKIQKQTVSEIGRLKIASANRIMNVIEPANGLQFHDNGFLNEEIEPMFTDLVIFVKKCNWFLPNELNSA